MLKPPLLRLVEDVDLLQTYSKSIHKHTEVGKLRNIARSSVDKKAHGLWPMMPSDLNRAGCRKGTPTTWAETCQTLYWMLHCGFRNHAAVDINLNPHRHASYISRVARTSMLPLMDSDPQIALHIGWELRLQVSAAADNPRDSCVTPLTLQTKVDAQCDKLETIIRLTKLTTLRRGEKGGKTKSRVPDKDQKRIALILAIFEFLSILYTTM